MEKKVKVLIITLEGDIKYQIGDDRTVEQVLKEIEECNTTFYQVIQNCAIKKDKINSVESVEYTTKED